MRIGKMIIDLLLLVTLSAVIVVTVISIADDFQRIFGL